VKYSVARRLIEKSLHLVAERAGMTVDELEDVSIPQYPLDMNGALEVTVADCKATVRLVEDGRVVVLWQNAEGKRVKAAPAHARKVAPKKIRAIAALTRDLEGSYSVQRSRLETSFLGTRRFPLTHWRRYYMDHPLLGFLGRKLIWVFSNSQGWERSGLWSDGEIRDSSNKLVDLARAEKVRLWHPLSYSAAEVQRWRTRIFTAGLRQPFRQAFREFYQVTDDERKTRLYSNRFAGILLRQHQFANLARARGWSYQLMGLGVDGVNVPSKKLEHWNMSVEFYVDLPPDRDHSVRRSSLAEQSGAGINVFIGSDQVRFYRDLREIPVDDVHGLRREQRVRRPEQSVHGPLHVRDVLLAVLAEVAAVRVEHRGGVVQDARLLLLVHRQHHDDAELGRERAEPLDRRSGDRLGVGVILRILHLAMRNAQGTILIRKIGGQIAQFVVSVKESSRHEMTAVQTPICRVHQVRLK